MSYNGVRKVEFSIPRPPKAFFSGKSHQELYSTHPYNPAVFTMNPYEAHYKVVQSANVKVDAPSWFGEYDSSHWYTGWGGGSPVKPALQEAVGKLAEKWRQSSFNAGVSLGESRESALMIAERCQQLSRAALDVRRGNLGAALRNLRKVAPKNRREAARLLRDSLDNAQSAWMELRYGWIPHFSDIYNLSELVGFKPHVNVIRAGKVNTVSPKLYWNGDEVGTMERYHKLYVTCYVSGQPSWPDRLGLTDPASIAWELVPGSFIADWISPIGSTISSLHALTHLPIQHACYTRVWGHKAIWPIGKTVTYRDFPVLGADCKPFNTELNMIRLIGLGSFSDYVNGLSQNVNGRMDPGVAKVADSVALLSQRLRFK